MSIELKHTYGKNNLTASEVIMLSVDELISNEITASDYLCALDEKGILKLIQEKENE